MGLCGVVVMAMQDAQDGGGDVRPRLIAVGDHISEEEFLALPGADAFRVRFHSRADRGWLLRELPEADAYWATLRLPLDAALLGAAARLQVVSTNTTGTDHLVPEELARRGIELLSMKNDTDFLRRVTPTAELAFGLLVACARRLPECFDASRQGYWGRHAFAGPMLSGKTLGLLGCGRLGTMMGEYGRAFRMRVLACDPCLSEFPPGVEPVALDRLLAESDFLSLHLHLSEQTRRIIGPPEFDAMRPGVILINTSRGGLVDESALIAAMESGRVAAAGLDVIDGEWMEDMRSHPLLAYSRRNPRLLITPHVGGTSPEATLLSCRHAMRKLAARFGAEVRTDG